MCNDNATVTAAAKTQRPVEDMLRDIAFVLRMTRQVKAEMRQERAAAEVEQQLRRRETKLEELMAVPM